MTKKTLNNEIRDYVMISIAMMSYCIGWNIFLLPNEITTGGVSGIASIIYWGTGIPVQNTYFFINAVLLVLAFKILGWKFCVKTVYAVTFLTIPIFWPTSLLWQASSALSSVEVVWG